MILLDDLMIAAMDQTNCPGSDNGGFDAADLLARLEGDYALLADMQNLFQHESALCLAALRTAADTADRETLQQVSHQLAGVAAVFSANDLESAARRVNALATADGESLPLGRVRAEIDELARLGKQLDQQLAALLASLSAE